MRIMFEDDMPCHKVICCVCCGKQGLQTPQCRMAQLELKRFAVGKQLNKNDVKGLLLEKAVSDTLHVLKMPHKHNPFNNTYPCYQTKNPDIIIDKLNTVIECKNLSRKQVNHLTTTWLDRHIIKRPNVVKYNRKLALFSYRPRKSLVRHLNRHGWRVYGLGTQILTFKQERKAIGKLIKKFYWLSKEYSQTQPQVPRQQTRLKLNYLKRVISM